MEVGFLLLAICFLASCSKQNNSHNFSENSRRVTLIENGLAFETSSAAQTVADFLAEQKITLNDHDGVTPEIDAKIYSGSSIIVQKARKVSINADGKIIKSYATGNNIEDALVENNVTLGEYDIVNPEKQTVAYEEVNISVTRVDIEEEAVKKNIPFDTKSNEDDKLGWRVKKVTQKGAAGIKEITYRVISHDGKEISRIALSENVIKDPVTEIVTQGTYMKLGKSKAGQGTWYSYRGGLFAASTTLPRGSYAKVTNTENGKSVVVQINDYGPFGKGRIIDLDKPAFQKIADIGAGVANVKVEPILN